MNRKNWFELIEKMLIAGLGYLAGMFLQIYKKFRKIRKKRKKIMTIEDIEKFMEQNNITRMELILGSFVITNKRKKRNEPYIQIYDPND